MRKLILCLSFVGVTGVLLWQAIPFVAFGVAIVQSADEPLMRTRPVLPLHDVVRTNKQDMPLAFVRWPESDAISGPLPVSQAHAEMEQSGAVHAELLQEGSPEFYKAQMLMDRARRAKEALAKTR